LSFERFHDILKDVSLYLPEVWELAMGSQYNQMPWYYMNTEAVMAADFHSFKLAILLPITVANDHFELYQMLAFPMRISNASYVRYQLENKYFAISIFRQTHFTLKELEFSQCKGDRVKVCPASKAVSGIKHSTCELSLFVQSLDARKLCRRAVSTKVPPPAILQRHGSSVWYFMPEPRQAHLRCRDGREWTSSNVVLEGGGSLLEAQGCHITVRDLQLQAAVQGATRIQDEMTLVLYPSLPAVTSPSEEEALERITADQRTRAVVKFVSS
jgi:hypothetical protein